MSTEQPQTDASNGLARRDKKARYILVGGFLGAGKTTSVLKLAEWLTKKRLRVGLITNDQGANLVDTAMLSAKEYPVEEISGGCFCCRFNSLVETSKRLNAQARPDVFIAEPVGSCTDVVATVVYPLRKMYGDNFAIAPVSVLVDPVRAMRIFNIQQGRNFSDKVIYIYKKQLEEADVIVINKCDLLSEQQIDSLKSVLSCAYPDARIFIVSARLGTGLDDWFTYIMSRERVSRAAIEVDYAIYADGEARLGWLNAVVNLISKKPIDSELFLKRLAVDIQRRLEEFDAEVAHLKMTLEPEVALGGIAVVNLIRNDFVPELSMTLEEPFQNGKLTVNLRAETTPETLSRIVQSAIEHCVGSSAGLTAHIENIECFQPSKPQPTYRFNQ